MVVAMLPTYDQVKTFTKEMYDEETRTTLVAKGLVSLGAEKVLPEAGVDYVASLSTYSGLVEKSVDLWALTLPYIKKAKYAEGRAELYSETSELVTDKIINPAVEVATPIIAEKKLKLTVATAPYIQKISSKKDALMTKKDAILADKRVEKALEGIKHVREHPKEVVAELKAQAVNLIKYDDLASYREYVQSAEFQEDTRRLIQVELPAIAADAALKGKKTLLSAAMSFQTELEVKGSAVADMLKRGYEWGKNAEFEELRGTALVLVAELKAQVATGIEQVKNGELSFSDIITKITMMYTEFGVTAATPSASEACAEPATMTVTSKPAAPPAAPAAPSQEDEEGCTSEEDDE